MGGKIHRRTRLFPWRQPSSRAVTTRIASWSVCEVPLDEPYSKESVYDVPREEGSVIYARPYWLPMIDCDVSPDGRIADASASRARDEIPPAWT